jgi:predicted ester cyclase
MQNTSHAEGDRQMTAQDWPDAAAPGLEAEKALVRAFYAALDAACPDEKAGVLAQYVTGDYRWRGFHPFDEIHGAEAVATRFWHPLTDALRPMQRRLDLLMAGPNQVSGGTGTWVATMGHLMGLFDRPWLGIPPTGKIAMLRYAAFHRIDGARIAESAMYFDIPHLMMQAGLSPFPPQTGAHLVQPGPLPHDALMDAPQDPAESARTLAVIDGMIADLKDWGRTGLSIEDELRRSWHEDMLWWGPAGIGATYTIERYARQHAGPFRAGFADRRFNGHVAKIAEGRYGGFFGWPNLTLRPTGGFMGLPGTGKPGDMRVIDIYRRHGDKLAENWIFIDLLHFWHQQGLDVLGRMADLPRS